MLAEQLVTCSVALLAGVVLWSMGVKILRPALGLAGLFIGAVLGWLTWTQVGDAAPMWALMLGFGIVVARSIVDPVDVFVGVVFVVGGVLS